MPLSPPMRPFAIAAYVAMTVVACAIAEVTSVTGGDVAEPHKYTVEELLSSHFEHKDSGDIGMDPCKAGKFSYSLKT